MDRIIGDGHAQRIEIPEECVESFESPTLPLAKEAIKILQLVNEMTTLPKIRILLCHVYYHSENYDECFKSLTDLKEMPTVTRNRRFRALYMCSLMLLIMKSSEGVTDILVEQCNAFATEWKVKFSEVMRKDLAFYVSVCLASWSLYSDEHTSWIPGETVFEECYDIASSLHGTLDWAKHNYWMISAAVLFVQIKLKCFQDERKICSFVDDTVFLREELSGLKHRIKYNYPLYWKTFKKLAKDVQRNEVQEG